MEQYLYLIINIAVLLSTLLLSFDKKVRFIKYWKQVLLAIFATAILFIIHDIWFTHIGVWGFNERYLTGVKLFNLPLSEILFFITIPYSCLFVYQTIETYKSNLFLYSRPIITALLVLVIYFTVANHQHLYSLFIGSTAVVALFYLLIFRPVWTNKMLMSYALLCVPFLVVNGLLTGTLITGEIVWYDSNSISNIRIGTIPIEDFIYSFLLILVNVLLFELLKQSPLKIKSSSNKN